MGGIKYNLLLKYLVVKQLSSYKVVSIVLDCKILYKHEYYIFAHFKMCDHENL